MIKNAEVRIMKGKGGNMKKTALLILACITILLMSVTVYANDCIQPIRVQIKVDRSGQESRPASASYKVKNSRPVSGTYQINDGSSFAGTYTITWKEPVEGGCNTTSAATYSEPLTSGYSVSDTATGSEPLTKRYSSASPATGSEPMTEGYGGTSADSSKSDDRTYDQKINSLPDLKSSTDEYNINKPAYEKAKKSGSQKSVTVTDTEDELHIYSDDYAGQGRDYGAKFSTDEFHTAPVDIKANDGYKKGGFDELHINENYAGRVWHPSKPVYRIEGFDEFRLPNEM